jgi:outer membrane receptor protein involved in Fe transport
MRNIYALIVFSLLCLNVIAQPGPRQDASESSDAVITGKIIDNITSQPIEYASVALYRMRDSSLVSGVVTDPAGNFTLTKLSFGRYYAEVSFIGYKKNRIKNITLNPTLKRAVLGTIKLDPSSTAINEVQVIGDKQTDYKIDKKVVNVSQQIAASGGSAIEVLENTPSVQTDVDGNLQLRGSSDFTVLVDGKPTILKGSEALQQIPASAIQNIEIITNPSAKYDAEGSAGIINVLTKKQKVKGFNGLVNLSAGTGNKYNGDFLINIRNSKLNYFVGGDFNDMKFTGKGKLDQHTTNDSIPTIAYQRTTSESDMHRSGKGLKAGLDYFIDDNNTLSLSGNISQRSFGRSSEAKYYEFTDPASTDTFYLQNNDSKGSHDNYSGNLDYRLKLKGNDHQLQATIYYEEGNAAHPNNMFKQLTNNNWMKLDTIPSIQKSTEDGREYEFRGKLDYSRPIGEKGKLEAGYQSRIEGSNIKYQFYNFLDAFVEDSSRFNRARYINHIEAVYTTYSGSTKWFDYQLGFRVEYGNRNITKKLTSEEYPIHRFDYFPTIHLTKQLPYQMQMQLSYSKRIRRPDDHDLDPFPNYIDQKHIRMGKPDLKPEFTGSYELNLQKNLGKNLLALEGFYRQTTDMISERMFYNPDTKIYTTTLDNFKRNYSAGAELTLNLSLTKWWNLSGTSSLYKYHIDGSEIDSSKSQNTVSANARFNTVFRMKWGMQIQVNYFYNAPSITPQGTREGYSFTNMGIKQEILKRKASVTLQVRDLFGTMKFASTYSTPNLYSYNSMRRESRVVTVTFTYRINNFKQQARREREEGTNESDFNGGGME